MHLYLKNKFIYFNGNKIKCSIGKNGLTAKKREGDLKTPKGRFKFKLLFYRKDRNKNLKSKIIKKAIKKNMGWCDDPSSKFYNKLIKFPFKKRAEKMYLKKKAYDLVLILNYNMSPVVKNKGSAIFMHIASKNYSSTKGCVAIKKNDFLKILSKISKKSLLIIS